MVKLSVVVPVFNVEAYLREALESLSRQTLGDLEVIMVDDGSTDGSALIAESFAGGDGRFRLLRQDNQGQGPARNLGARLAAGEFLAFFDGDDVLPPHAYDLLVGSLEATGSELAAGGVRRLTSTGVHPSHAHGEVFRDTVLRTSVARFPVMLRDCTVWNKVYRRSFWERAGLGFPAVRYEDNAVAIRGYVLARSVDVLRDVVYYWRVRESGDLSRPQRAREVENVRARMAAVLDASGFLAARAPALKPDYDRAVLDTHLGVLLRAVEFAGRADRERLVELAGGYLGSVDDAVFADAPVIQRLQYHLARAGRPDELVEVLRYKRAGDAARAPVVRLGRKWYVSYPYLGDRSRGIPLDVYDAGCEMTLCVRLDAVSWQAGRLRVEGHAYIRRLDAPGREDTGIQVMLRNTVLRRVIPLRVQRVSRPDVTARSGQSAACYDWSGFVVEISPARLSNLGTWRAASWELRVRVAGRGVRREGPVSSLEPGSATLPEGRWVADGVWLQPAPEHDGRFLIRAARPAALVTGCRSDGVSLVVEGWSAVPLGERAAVAVVRRQAQGTSARFPAAATGTVLGRYGFCAAIPATALLAASGTADRTPDNQEPLAGTDQSVLPADDEVHWDLALDPGTGHPVRLAGEPGAAGTRLAAAGQEITSYQTPYGSFSVIQRARRLIVRQANWTPAGSLVLRGDYAGAEDAPQTILLRSARSGYQHTVPLRWHDGVFSAEVSPGSMPGQAGDLPLANGRWQLLAQTVAGESRVVADRGLLARLPALRQDGLHAVKVETYRGDALLLSVRLASAELGGYAQQQLREWYGSQVASAQIEDIAVFDSHGGKQYSCNPRAVYEELRRRDSGLRCVWISYDGQFRVPDGGQVVAYQSREHYQLAARARLVVSNALQPKWYRKPAGQLYLQTWHGTPLKRICLDVEHPQFASGLAYHDQVRADVAGWDALVSANAFSTAIFRKAFGFDGDILEFGYPRNDVLAGPDAAGLAARVRGQLGLPAGARTVLYAPTWRDDATTRADGYGFPQHLDLGAVTRALGDDYVTLVRAHPMIKETLVTGTADSKIIDVTRYPDMADLLLIADVLITDYSSVMFDFALTGRPMLFFAYDLERYRDKLRGFYFDFEAEAPGPLLRSSDEVIDAARDLAGISRSYRAAYAGFAARFGSLEDGHAAARTVDWLLSR
jgi:CDP-glycerol glycerophosphotransferase